MKPFRFAETYVGRTLLTLVGIAALALFAALMERSCRGPASARPRIDTGPLPATQP